MAKNAIVADRPADDSAAIWNGDGGLERARYGDPSFAPRKGRRWKVADRQHPCAVLRPQEAGIRCIDTDPVNRTIFQYKGLHVTRLELLREGGID